MAENTNTERADFEAWYIAKIRESLPSAGDGWSDDQIRDSFMGFSQDRGYRSSSAQQAWGAWQARASLSLPAAGQEPAATGANWEQLRSALAMLMLGWLSNPNRSMEGCNAVLDSVTEPGMPLAILRSAPDWRAAPQPAVAAGREQIAEAALRKVLAAVQRHMPPDGPDAQDTLSEIIAIVDPWPLGPLEKP